MAAVLVIQEAVDLAEGWLAGLRENGYEAVLARDTDAAVLRVKEGGFDVIVIDAAVLAVTDFATQLDTIPDAPPMLLVSDSPQAPQLSARVGAAGLLLKPCSIDELREKVARIGTDTSGIQFFENEPTSPSIALKLGSFIKG